MKKELKSIAMVSILWLSVIACLPLTAVGVEQTELSIEDVSVASGETGITSIMINVTDPSGLGAATINLTYDPSVCVVTNVVKGPSSFDSLTSTHLYTNTSGYVRMVAYQSESLTGVGPGLIKFADVTLKAVGNPGNSSTLSLTIETLKNNTGKPVPYTVMNGTFTIREDTPPIVKNPRTEPVVIPEDTDNEPLWGELAELMVNATDESGIANITITVNLSSVGKEMKIMNNIGNFTDAGGTRWAIFNCTTNASSGTAGWYGSAYVPYQLEVNATDIYGNSNTSVSIELTVMKNGDVSEDGVTDSWDCTYLARYLVGGIPGYGEIVEGVAEVSGDCTVDSWDCTYLARYLVGEIPGYEKLK